MAVASVSGHAKLSICIVSETLGKGDKITRRAQSEVLGITSRVKCIPGDGTRSLHAKHGHSVALLATNVSGSCCLSLVDNVRDILRNERRDLFVTSLTIGKHCRRSGRASLLQQITRGHPNNVVSALKLDSHDEEVLEK